MDFVCFDDILRADEDVSYEKSNGGSVFPMKEGQVFIMKNADAVFATSLMRPSQLLCGR